jgi:hypothetical protein
MGFSRPFSECNRFQGRLSHLGRTLKWYVNRKNPQMGSVCLVHVGMCTGQEVYQSVRTFYMPHIGECCHHYCLGRSDPAPMTAPVPIGMNSSSTQLLDLLQALRLGQFFFFSLAYFKATH